MDQDWLLYVVVCGGKGLHIGPSKAEGDLFCMIHTQVQEEPRSRTVVLLFVLYLVFLLAIKANDIDSFHVRGAQGLFQIENHLI
jgi:hypothetical protein